MSDLTATASQERIVELDLMRGFALFGILVVNMLFFGMPIYTAITDLNPLNNPLDLAGRFLLGIVFEGKFITLFSFMFGLGFWIFISRARAKGRTAGPLFLRRLFILALFGAAHAFLFWAGDILLFYAMLGLVMMLFLNRTDKTLKVWIVLLPVLHILFIVAFVGLFSMAMNSPEAAQAITEGLDEARLEMEAMAASAMEIYRTGTFTEMMEIRRQELAFAYQGFIMGGVGVFYLLAVFLAGMYAGRMSLTVYLTQSLVMTTIFYGYGLGLYGAMPVWMMILLAVSFFAVQMALSRWWMKHFTMGPFEWLWRAATYGYLPALRK